MTRHAALSASHRSRNRSDRRRSRNRERRRVGGKQVLQTYRGGAPLEIDSINVGTVYKIGPFNQSLSQYSQMGLRIIAAQYQLYRKKYSHKFSDDFIDVLVTSKDDKFIRVKTYPETWVKDDVTLLVDGVSFSVIATEKKSPMAVPPSESKMQRYPKRAPPETSESPEPPAKKTKKKIAQPEYLYADEFEDLRHGKKISVFWEEEDEWFRGRIEMVDPDKFIVRYDDGDYGEYTRYNHPLFRIFRTGRKPKSSDAGAAGSSSQNVSAPSFFEPVKSSPASREIQQLDEPVVKFEDGESVFYDCLKTPCTIINLMPRKQWYNVLFADGTKKSVLPEKLHRSKDDYSRYVATIPEISDVVEALREDVNTEPDQQVFTVFDGDNHEHKIVLEPGTTSTYKLVTSDGNVGPDDHENWVDFLKRKNMRATPPVPTTPTGEPVEPDDMYRAASSLTIRKQINLLCMASSEEIVFESVTLNEYKLFMTLFTTLDEFEMTWFLLTAIFQNGTIVVRTYGGLFEQTKDLLSSVLSVKKVRESASAA